MITKKHLGLLHNCVYCTFIVSVVIYTTGFFCAIYLLPLVPVMYAFISSSALCAPLIFATWRFSFQII